MVRLKEGWRDNWRRGWRDVRQRNSTGRGGGRVKVTLFITALLEKYFSWSSSFHSCQSISALSVYLCFFISPLPSLPLTLCSSVSISLYLPLFLSFCWHCPVRDFNEMPVFEVEWWRWGDAIKNLIFTAERTCVSVCFPQHLWSDPTPHTCWHQEKRGGTYYNENEMNTIGATISFFYWKIDITSWSWALKSKRELTNIVRCVQSHRDILLGALDMLYPAWTRLLPLYCK